MATVRLVGSVDGGGGANRTDVGWEGVFSTFRSWKKAHNPVLESLEADEGHHKEDEFGEPLPHQLPVQEVKVHLTIHLPPHINQPHRQHPVNHRPIPGATQPTIAIVIMI